MDVITQSTGPVVHDEFIPITLEEAAGLVDEAYRSGSTKGFAETVLELVADPLAPREVGKRRKFHPVFITLCIGAAALIAIILYFAFTS